MNIQTISFNFNFKSTPEEDATVNILYQYYYGHGIGSDDPSEIEIVSGMKNLIPMSDLEIEEVRSKAEYEIVTELKADREDRMYHNWKERNL